jgi:hypothetical protein
MYPRTAAGKNPGRIREYDAVLCDHPQQGGFIGAGATAKAGSYGFHTTPTNSALAEYGVERCDMAGEGRATILAQREPRARAFADVPLTNLDVAGRLE